MNPRRAAQGALVLGLIIAISANLTYAIPRGGVTVGLGLVAPLVLPVVLYLRTTFTVSGFWQTTFRETATLAVAGPAAAVSYVHTYQLVLDAGEWWILAVLAPLSSDGLAGMATLALHRLRQVEPAQEARVAAPSGDAATRPAPRVEAPTPRPAEPKQAPPPSSGLLEEATQWAVEELAAGRTAGLKRVWKQYPGLSEHFARKAAGEAKRRHDQARPALKAVAGS